MKLHHTIPILLLAIVSTGCTNTTNQQKEADKAAFLQYLNDSLVIYNIGGPVSTLDELIYAQYEEIKGDTVDIMLLTEGILNITPRIDDFLSYNLKAIASRIILDDARYTEFDFSNYGVIFHLTMKDKNFDPPYYETTATPQDYLPLAISMDKGEGDYAGYYPKEYYQLSALFTNEFLPSIADKFTTIASEEFDGDLIHTYEINENLSNRYANMTEDELAQSIQTSKENIIEGITVTSSYTEIKDYQTYDINLIYNYYNSEHTKLLFSIEISPDEVLESFYEEEE